MTFTDDDLKHLKLLAEEQIGGGPSRFVGRNELEGIIARLEAAEACAQLLKIHQESGLICDGDQGDDAVALQTVKAWRKAAGK